MPIHNVEVRFIGPARGAPIDALLTVAPMHDTKGAVVGLRWLVRDITQRKRMEETLRESEERYRLISQMISDYAFALRVTEHGPMFVEWLTESFTRITGYPVTDVLGRPDPWCLYFHPDDIERVTQIFKTVTPDTPTRYEFRIIRKDGSIRWLRSHIRTVHSQEGLRVYGSTQDITEHKQAEEEIRKLNAELEQRVLERTAQLQESEARYRQLFENANDAIAIVARDGRFIAVNQKVVELTGVPKEELIGKTMELFFPREAAQSLQRFEQTVAKGKLGPRELEVATPLGKKTFSLSTFPYFQENAPVGIIGIARDITEELRQKQERESLYQFVRDLIRLTDIYTIGEQLFAHVKKLFGADYGDLLLADAGSAVLRGIAAYGAGIENFHEEQTDVSIELSAASSAFQRREPVVIENYAHNPLVSERLQKKYHFLRDVWSIPLFSGEKLIGVFGMGYLTPQQANPEQLHFLQLLGNEAALALERARLTEELQESERRFRELAQEREQQLIASDRLVSAGELAASLAHEFNNPLHIVLGFVEDLLTEVDPSDPFYRPLTIIQEEARRCQKLVRELLDFARPAPANPCWTDLKEIIHKSIELASVQLQKRQVKTAFDIQPDIPRVYIDVQQLQQVLLNLFFNALEAMPNGGTLTVRATVRARGANNGTGNGQAPFPAVRIAVTDTGIGIDQADLRKIFRPFFSAKKTKGMGLGLSICAGIVKAHGGRIEVESVPGQGTTVCIFLPLKKDADGHYA